MHSLWPVEEDHVPEDAVAMSSEKPRAIGRNIINVENNKGMENGKLMGSNLLLWTANNFERVAVALGWRRENLVRCERRLNGLYIIVVRPSNESSDKADSDTTATTVVRSGRPRAHNRLHTRALTAADAAAAVP